MQPIIPHGGILSPSSIGSVVGWLTFGSPKIRRSLNGWVLARVGSGRGNRLSRLVQPTMPLIRRMLSWCAPSEVRRQIREASDLLHRGEGVAATLDLDEALVVSPQGIWPNSTSLL